MAKPRARSSIRKGGGTRLGTKVARFSVGDERRLFTVHEDVVCVSPFFRNILQPRRKAIEGDCSICHEVLDAAVKELTYCSTSCGGNFHRDCMANWERRTSQRDAANCPLCRQRWTAEHWMSIKVHQLHNVDADAFNMFVEWSYTASMSYDEDNDEIQYQLIQAYAFGDKTGDKEFCENVLMALFKDYMKHRTYPRADQVDIAYINTSGPCRLRTFLVGLYTHLSAGKFKRITPAEWDEYPSEFLRDLTLALVARRGKKTVRWTTDALEQELFPKEPDPDNDQESESSTDDEEESEQPASEPEPDSDSDLGPLRIRLRVRR